MCGTATLTVLSCYKRYTYPKDRDFPQGVLSVYFAIRVHVLITWLLFSRDLTFVINPHYYHQRQPASITSPGRN